MFDETRFDILERKLKRYTKLLKELRAASDMDGLEAAAINATKFERIANRLRGVLSDINGDLTYSSQIHAGLTRQELRRLEILNRRKQTMGQIEKMVAKERDELEKMTKRGANTSGLNEISDKILAAKKAKDDAAQAANLDALKSKLETEEKKPSTRRRRAEIAELQDALNEAMREQATYDQEIAKLEADKTSELQKQSKLADEINSKKRQLNDLEEAAINARKADQIAQAARKRANAVVNLRSLGKKGFMGMGNHGVGGLFSALGTGGNLFGTVFRSLGPALGLGGGAAAAAGVAGGAAALAALSYWKMMEREAGALKVLHTGGLSGDQSINESMGIQNTRSRLFKQHVYASPEMVAQASMGLQTQFGGMAFPEKLMDNAALLMAHFHVGAEDAGKLQAAVFRLSGNSEKAATSMTKFLASLSGGRSNVKMITSLLAQSTEEIAKSGMSNEFVRTAASLAQSGVTMNTMSKMADKMSTDFEGTLEMQAKLALYAPGTDLQRTQQAAIYGDISSFTTEFKSALKGIDMRRLTRGQQIELSNTLGFNGVEELKNFLTGKGDLRDIQTKTYDEIQAGHTELVRLVTGQTSMIGLLTDIASAIVNPKAFKRLIGGDEYNAEDRIKVFQSNQDYKDALDRAHAHAVSPVAPSSPEGSSPAMSQQLASLSPNMVAIQMARQTTPGPSQAEFDKWEKMLGMHFGSVVKAVKENKDVYVDSSKVTDVLHSANRGM